MKKRILDIDTKRNIATIVDDGKVYEVPVKRYNLIGTLVNLLSLILVFIAGVCSGIPIYDYITSDTRPVTVLVPEIHVAEKLSKRKEAYGPFKPLRLVKIWEWSGGEKIDKTLLSETVYAVMKKLGVAENKNFHDLILETCAVETDLGYIVKQINGSALSMYQIMPNTYKYILNKLERNNNDLYKKLMYLYDHRKGDNYNNVHNVPFTTAVCILYYLDVVQDIHNRIKTRKERAEVWKQWYNTPSGKGTVETYMKKAERHI